MAEVLSFVATMTIPSGGTNSNVVTNNTLQGMRRLIVRAPATLTGTVTVHCAPTKVTAFGDLAPLRISPNASDVTVPAGKELRVDVGGVKSLGLQSSTAEAAARTFQVYCTHEV